VARAVRHDPLHGRHQSGAAAAGQRVARNRCDPGRRCALLLGSGAPLVRVAQRDLRGVPPLAQRSGSAGDDVDAVRLVDLVAAVSRLADLGFGFPPGASLRSSALAVVLARSLQLPDEDVRAGLYTGLLLHAGCVGYAHETSRLFGDEFTVQVAAERADRADPGDVARTLLPRVLSGRQPLDKLGMVVTAVTRGQRHGQAFDIASCEVGRSAARRLGLPDAVQVSIYHAHEWWNGGGVPDALAGDDIPAGARLAAAASVAVLFESIGGAAAAAAAVRQRSGGILDPAIAAHFADRAERLLGEVAASDPYDVVSQAEPAPVASVSDPGLVEVAAVFGDLADLKSPHFHGHARGVARLARGGGEHLGLPGSDLDDLELAGLLQDVGRVTVSTSVWEKRGPLTSSEWEQVRLHAYHSERILSGSRRLAPLSQLVGGHHERSDGSGYHRGCTAAELSVQMRILAAADAYTAMTEPRPHRPARPPEDAERELRHDAADGRLDAEVVTAVLAAAGHDPTPLRRELPAGLTDRQVQVLRLVAHGCTNRQIADRLVISRRTAEYHVQQIYLRIGTSSRAAAAMFAMEHRLLDGEDR
jgi:HD-GYP domain-containing protein (c-di-GMP phosphodiesterase class II)